MSHVKNVEAFEKLVGICTGLGGNYNPGQQNLKTDSITVLLATARAALDAVHTARKDFVIAANKREAEFAGMRIIAQRIINDLKSSGVPEKTVSDVLSIYRKLVGYRISRDPVTPSADAAEIKPVIRKARGEDYVTQAETFSILVKRLADEPAYNPGISELTVPALHELLRVLMLHNTTVVETKRKLNDACVTRDKVMYEEEGSLLGLSRAIKYQLRAIHGLKSDAYKPAIRIIIKAE